LTAAFRFEGTVRTAIHQLKYRGARYLARPLGDALLDAVDPIETPDAFVPVPLHPARQAERGYNQSTLLARALGHRLGVPVLETGLVRVRDTPAQVKVPAAQRWTNVQNAFGVPSRELVGLRVMLVDDVATTSSTMRAAARAVVVGGAARVDAIVVARAVPTALGGNGTIVA
jgi:ComF family protein